jgi:hypothetical protein
MAHSYQGDQIGLIFAQWAIVYFRQFWENYINYPHFWYNFFLSICRKLILAEKGLGDILGDFLTNSSGHPDSYS